MTGDRRLAAIMFTDLAGFTALGQRDEPTALALAEEHRGLLRPLFGRFGGREVKTMGDGFLIEFPNALDAVRCALELQRAVRDRNSGAAGGAPIELRVGIHLGDVVETEGDIAGDAVNVASRLQPLADRGGICISQQVYDQVYNKVDRPMERVPEVRLKNVERPLTVYRLGPAGPRGVVDPRPISHDRLAVLPFVNISPDPKDEYLADGMTEELIGRLSAIGGLKVIARTSVMPFKHKELRLAEIAQELRVGAVLEGSVRRAGDKIRVAVQLVDARSEEHLWAAHYDKQLTDVFEVQSDVATNVARSLSRDVFGGHANGETDRVDAYTLYLQGARGMHEQSSDSVAASLELFDRAIAIDPAFGRAHAARARALCFLAILGAAPWESIELSAAPAARRAVEVAPASAEAHAALAFVALFADRMDEATRETEEAIRLNPSLASAYETLGSLLILAGKTEEAIAALRRGYELDPLSVSGATTFAWYLQLGGHDTEALEVIDRISRTNRQDADVFAARAEYHSLRREWEPAESVLTEGLALYPHDNQLLADRARIWATVGRTADARRALAEIRALGHPAGFDAAELFVGAALNDLDAAFRALDSLAERHSWPTAIVIHPVFARMREDPRYAAFRRKVGLHG